MFPRCFSPIFHRDPSPDGRNAFRVPRGILILHGPCPRKQENSWRREPVQATPRCPLRQVSGRFSSEFSPRSLPGNPSGLSPQAWRAEPRHPKSRAGSSRTARTSARSASNVMPISRKGSVKSQTRGKRISASRAKGQQSTKRMHQPTKRIRAFTSLSFHHAASRQRYAVSISFCLGNFRYEAALQVGRRL